MNFRLKVIVSSVLVSALFMVLTTFSVLSTLRDEVLNHAENRLTVDMEKQKKEITKMMEEKALLLRQSSRLVGNLVNVEYSLRDEEIHDYFRTFVIDNPEIINLALFYDNASGYDASETVKYSYFNEGGNLLVSVDTLLKSELGADHPHIKIKVNKTETSSEVFTNQIWGDNVPTVTYSLPVTYRGSLIGTLHADISLHGLATLLKNEVIISETDQVLYHPESRYNTLNMKESPLGENAIELLLSTSINERSLDWDLFNNTILVIDAFSVGNTHTHWRMLSEYSFASIYQTYNAEFNRTVYFILAGLVILGFVMYLITAKQNRSLQLISSFSNDLSTGNTDVSKIEHYQSLDDDLDGVFTSLKSLANSVKDKTDFTLALREGNLQAEISVNENDQLSSALISLRRKLQEASIESERRQWINEGLTRFSAILRDYTNDFDELSNVLISELVRYLEANQGSIYLLEDDEEKEKVLNLRAAYAYNRKKFIQKSIPVGEGMVGQAFLEKSAIYLKEIPEDYIQITSGLGEAVPTVLIVLPLKVESDVNGIIEIASFKEFESHEIDFLEKLAESISLTIKNAQNNEATRKLLKQSQIQAEELKSAEEEMRQNMEELQTTQEELNRKAKETDKMLSTTERKRQLSDLQIEISTTLSTATTSDGVYEVVVKEIGEKLNFDFGCAYSVGLARGKRVFNSLDKFYNSNHDLFDKYQELNAGNSISIKEDILSLVYQDKAPKFFNGFESLEAFLRKDDAIASHLKSVYLFPVAIGKKVTGILEFYKEKECEEDTNIIEFGMQMGKQLGEVLSRVKLSEATMINEEAMAKWQYDMRAIVDGLPAAMVVIDENGKIENNNKKFITFMNLNILTVAKESFYTYVEDKSIRFETGNTYKTTLSRPDADPVHVSIKCQEIKKNDGMRSLLLIDEI